MLVRSSVAVVASLAMFVGLTGTAGAAAKKALVADRNSEIRFGQSYGWVGPLDPHRTLSPSADAVWLRPLYDSLFQIGHDAKGQVVIVPQLALSYKPAADSRSFDLVLRTGVKFQDGNAFNAAAVKANLERAKDSKSTITTFYKNMNSVIVKDDTHVTLQLTDPDPAFPWTLRRTATG